MLGELEKMEFPKGEISSFLYICLKFLQKGNGVVGYSRKRQRREKRNELRTKKKKRQKKKGVERIFAERQKEKVST